MNFRVPTILTMIITFLIPAGAFASEFQANMVKNLHGKTHNAKIFVKGDKYRLEEEEMGERIFIIVDQGKNTTRVFNPKLKQYMEMKSDLLESCMNDPFQSAKRTAANGKARRNGVKKVGGRKCSSYILSVNSTDVMTQCISKELDFPIRVSTLPDGGRSMDLLDIKEGPVDATLFETPKGYTLLKRPGGKK